MEPSIKAGGTVPRTVPASGVGRAASGRCPVLLSDPQRPRVRLIAPVVEHKPQQQAAATRESAGMKQPRDDAGYVNQGRERNQ